MPREWLWYWAGRAIALLIMVGAVGFIVWGLLQP